MNLQAGAIVSLSHDGRQRLALVPKLPKHKQSEVTVIFDPEKTGVYLALPKPRSALTVCAESAETKAARARIKAVRESQGGHAELGSGADTRTVRPDSERRPGESFSRPKGFPVRRQPPVVLATSTAHGGYVTMSPDMEKYIWGSKYDWARARLKAFPRTCLVWHLREELQLSPESVAKMLGMTHNAVYQRYWQARAKMREYYDEYDARQKAGEDLVA